MEQTRSATKPGQSSATREQARHEAEQIGHEASQKAQQLTEQTRHEAEELKGEAQKQAQKISGQAQSKAKEQVDKQSKAAGHKVAKVAKDLRAVGDELRKRGDEAPANLADQAAQKAEQFGSYLENSSADNILHDAEAKARQEPWLVIAGGITLGFLASRFLKASSSKRHQRQTQQSPTQQTPTPMPTQQTADVYAPLPEPALTVPTAPAGATATYYAEEEGRR